MGCARSMPVTMAPMCSLTFSLFMAWAGLLDAAALIVWLLIPRPALSPTASAECSSLSSHGLQRIGADQLPAVAHPFGLALGVAERRGPPRHLLDVPSRAARRVEEHRAARAGVAVL